MGVTEAHGVAAWYLWYMSVIRKPKLIAVTFACNTAEFRWSQEIEILDIRDLVWNKDTLYH